MSERFLKMKMGARDMGPGVEAELDAITNDVAADVVKIYDDAGRLSGYFVGRNDLYVGISSEVAGRVHRHYPNISDPERLQAPN